MKLLITGACGFVGSRLAEALRQQASADQMTITGMDNLSRSGSWVNRKKLAALDVDVVHGDLRCTSDLDSLGSFDWIIDAAANPSVLAGVGGGGSSRQLVEHNLGGTINILECCKRWQAGLILLSTSRVYSIPPLAGLPVVAHGDAFCPDTSKSLPQGVSASGISEQFSSSSPVSLYGATKLASEAIALEYGHAFDFPVWVNRCGVMAGAGQFGKADQGIFAFWLHSWREGYPLRYIGFEGTGFQVRDCLHPRDLAALILKQFKATAAANSIFNVSGGIESAMSLAQLSQWCQNRWGPRDVDGDPTPRKYDLPWVVLDDNAARQTFQWRPTLSTEDILTEIAEFAEQHSDWIELSR